ncbi:MAG TPA: LuxR C-terminal-related transcriptional regulator [Catenuloplanes sp.]|jgi:predicted ATPase/DNA-binding CsgD family transcriptional regulator
MPARGRVSSGNLPAEATSFVGRRRELGEVRRLLVDARLATLTGVGGTGKTRLARRAAADLRRAFTDGAWFVDLTDLHDPRQLCRSVADPDVLAYLVAAVLGLPDQPGQQPMRLLADQLADRHMLLVLDNCEHLLPACASLADTLLRAAPRLRVLATSREPLAVPGEVIFAVPPLLVPERAGRPTLADLLQCEAVALFVARAQAAMQAFQLTEDNRGAVAELCHRLDGLPLAIELAAARIRVLAPQQILDRLTDRFGLLSRGNRTAPERQQTLRACVDWSFDLCLKPEQTLWTRLTVFAGAFELDAVESVCTDEQLPPAEVLDVLAGLVDKSILACEDLGSVVRYRMLETIRDFGREKLRLATEESGLRRRHRDWYQQLVALARAQWVSDRQPYWLARLGREHPNLRTAVEYCLTEPGQAEDALRIIGSLPVHYWWSRRLLTECRSWLERALGQAGAPTALRARSLLLASDLAFVHGDAGSATRLLAEGEHLAQQLDDPAATAHASYTRAIGTLHTNDLPATVRSCERALAVLATVPRPESELDLHLRLLIALGVAAAMAGARDRAGACRTELLSITHRLGSDFYRSSALWSCGVVSWLHGDLPQAAAEVAESLRLKRAAGLGDDFGTALCLEVLAWITASQQRYARAATLLGGAEALRAGQGTRILSYRHLVPYHDECERQAREAVGDAAFVDALRYGQGLSYEEMLAYALDERRPSVPSASPATPTPLTRREREISELVARGLSNKDIAATLLISPRTAESHIENILNKLGFTSRSQVAAWVTAQRATSSDPGTA